MSSTAMEQVTASLAAVYASAEAAVMGLGVPQRYVGHAMGAAYIAVCLVMVLYLRMESAVRIAAGRSSRASSDRRKAR